MKRIILLAVIAACGGTNTGDDDTVDGGTDAAIDGGVCGDGACADAETPDTCGVDCVPGGPVCGDGTCEGSESPANCASDCGAPACTAANDTCTGDTLCVGGACVAAFPRTYVITDVVVSISTTNQGAMWDPDSSAPDLYLGNQNDFVRLTPTVTGLAVTFPGPIEVTLTAAGLQYRLYVWDDDGPPVQLRQTAFACQRFPSASELRARTLLPCAYNNSSLSLTINPK
jgi:hypothetical protein